MGRSLLSGTPNSNIMPLRLTEENLRLHSCAHMQHEIMASVEVPQTTDMPDQSYLTHNHNMEGSDDGDLDAYRDDMALRKAASIEAMQAYGGCFASGFFAMQEPLPWTKLSQNSSLQRMASNKSSVGTGSITTSSCRLPRSTGMPRPDSDTLSNPDVQLSSPARKWRWSSLVKGAKSPKTHTGSRPQ
ncbi:hypothetical protein ACN47E_007357 [Coniothyrium glycines]